MKLKSIQHSSPWHVAFTSVVCALGISEASEVHRGLKNDATTITMLTKWASPYTSNRRARSQYCRSST